MRKKTTVKELTGGNHFNPEMFAFSSADQLKYRFLRSNSDCSVPMNTVDCCVIAFNWSRCCGDERTDERVAVRPQ